MIRTLAIASLALALSACGTVSKVAGADRFAPKTTEQIQADRLERLREMSRANLITRDRMVVEAWGGSTTDIETIEYRLLARAGDEVHQLGFTHFVILELTAMGDTDSSALGRTRAIGTYEDLIRSREDRGTGSFWKNGLSAVIQPLNADARAVKRGEAFEGLVLYDNLVRQDDLIN